MRFQELLPTSNSLNFSLLPESLDYPVDSCRIQFNSNLFKLIRNSMASGMLARAAIRRIAIRAQSWLSLFISSIRSLISLDTGLLPGVLCLYVQKFLMNLRCQFKIVEGFINVKWLIALLDCVEINERKNRSLRFIFVWIFRRLSWRLYISFSFLRSIRVKIKSLRLENIVLKIE